ncbi:hypothetical protein ACJX0J_041325, partial [Zea mays]
ICFNLQPGLFWHTARFLRHYKYGTTNRFWGYNYFQTKKVAIQLVFFDTINLVLLISFGYEIMIEIDIFGCSTFSIADPTSCITSRIRICYSIKKGLLNLNFQIKLKADLLRFATIYILFTVKGFDLSFVGHPLCGHFHACFDLLFRKPHLC